jgi:hypothetical protein
MWAVPRSPSPIWVSSSSSFNFPTYHPKPCCVSFLSDSGLIPGSRLTCRVHISPFSTVLCPSCLSLFQFMFLNMFAEPLNCWTDSTKTMPATNFTTNVVEDPKHMFMEDMRFPRRWLWRMASYGMWRRVALVRTDVSEGLSSVRLLLITDSVVPNSPIFVTLMKEALSSSEKSVLQESNGVTSQKTSFLTCSWIWRWTAERWSGQENGSALM